MNRSSHVQTFWHFCLLMLLVLSIQFAPAAALPVHAQNVPTACLTDGGQPVRPNAAYLSPGWTTAWAMILNFNHAPSATTTTGCVATISAVNPAQVSYQLVQCPLINNTAAVTVGGGAADYDGNFWIECPGVTNNRNTYTSFGVAGRAQYPVPGSTFTLFDHPSVTISVAISPIWRTDLTSRYGANSYTNPVPPGSVIGKVVGLKSEVLDSVGTHYVNGNALTPNFTPGPIVFDESRPMRFGAAGQRATLYQVIVDPPGHCCVS